MVGHFVTHALGILLLSWRRMSLAALIAFGVAFVLVEAVGSALFGHFPAPTLVHVVAMVFALVTAYAVALTVFIDELFIGAIDMLSALGGEAGAGAKAIAIASERRSGEAGSGIMRWLGVRPSRSIESEVINQPEGLVFAENDEPYSAEDQWKQTQADIEATDEFVSTAPRPRVNARPVQATQLPRIEWALERLEQERQTSSTSATQATLATAARVTRPITRPLPRQEDEGHSPVEAPRGIWSRISKTLVGNVHPPVDNGEAPEAEVPGSEEA
jgi:hypothetical protein